MRMSVKEYNDLMEKRNKVQIINTSNNIANRNSRKSKLLLPEEGSKS